MFYWVPPEGGIGSPGPPAHGYPPEKKEDKEITEAVHLAFFLDPDVDDKQFSVRTENGIVYLAGIAKTEEERRRVHDLALSVEGVREVINEVRVVGSS